jgi:alkanesulfonate monooxygenase SsuD/methylene tetrahydromethanopterin reductase-like flavin-dependent oxidoreductase (luciferase family)
VFLGVSSLSEYWGLDAYSKAESFGFDGLFTGEHFHSHRSVWDAVTLCTAMACSTGRMAIGSAAIIAPFRHPTVLAKELAGLDRISGGRLIVGLTDGGVNQREFAAVGSAIEDRSQKTIDAIAILRGFFSGERFSYEGLTCSVEDVWLDPPPAQPHVPIWIAGRVGQVAAYTSLVDGYLAVLAAPEECLLEFDRIRRSAEASNVELGSSYAWGAHVYVSVGDDSKEAVERGDKHLAWRYADSRFLTTLSGKYVVAGRPAECVEGLRRFIDRGCTHVIVGLIRPEGESPVDAMDRVATDLLPDL